jgi:hypothetical protein
MTGGGRGIPRGWWCLFVVELPLIAGTIVYLLAAPRAFALGAFGIEQLDAPVHTLLLSYASVVATAVGWFYGRLLLAPRIDLPTFRRYQEALLLGDLGVAAIWSWSLAVGAAHGAAPIAGLVMATFWGAIRVVFLFRVRVAP